MYTHYNEVHLHVIMSLLKNVTVFSYYLYFSFVFLFGNHFAWLKDIVISIEHPIYISERPKMLLVILFWRPPKYFVFTVPKINASCILRQSHGCFSWKVKRQYQPSCNTCLYCRPGETLAWRGTRLCTETSTLFASRTPVYGCRT